MIGFQAQTFCSCSNTHSPSMSQASGSVTNFPFRSGRAKIRGGRDLSFSRTITASSVLSISNNLCLLFVSFIFSRAVVLEKMWTSLLYILPKLKNEHSSLMFVGGLKPRIVSVVVDKTFSFLGRIVYSRLPIASVMKK